MTEDRREELILEEKVAKKKEKEKKKQEKQSDALQNAVAARRWKSNSKLWDKKVDKRKKDAKAKFEAKSRRGKKGKKGKKGKRAKKRKKSEEEKEDENDDWKKTYILQPDDTAITASIKFQRDFPFEETMDVDYVPKRKKKSEKPSYNSHANMIKAKHKGQRCYIINYGKLLQSIAIQALIENGVYGRWNEYKIQQTNIS